MSFLNLASRIHRPRGSSSARAQTAAWCAATLAGFVMTTGAQASAGLCGGEIPPAGVDCALDFGIERNTDIDQSDRINQALTGARIPTSSLFFPEGRYVVNDNVVLPASGRLFGSKKGETRWINNSGQQVLIAESILVASPARVVEGLVLEDIGINSSFAGSDMHIRYNVLIGNTPGAALLTATLGKQRIHGNVLLRGVQGLGPGMESDAGKGIHVSGNLIGSTGHLEEAAAFVDQRTVQLAQRTFERLPELQTSGGHFTQGWYVNRLHRGAFERNAVMLNPLTPEQRQLRKSQGGGGQFLLTMEAPQQLHIADNYFNAAADSSSPTEDKGAPVRLRSPQGVTVSGNTFDQAGVRVESSDDNRPVKRVAVVNNGFYGAHVSLRKPVDGSGADHTGPDDVVVLGNYFYVSDACPMDAAPVTAGTRNFFAAANLDLALKPVPVCHLSPVDRQEALNALQPQAREDAGRLRFMVGGDQWQSEDMVKDREGRPLDAFLVPPQLDAQGPTSVVSHSTGPAAITLKLRSLDGGSPSSRALQGTRNNGCTSVAMNDNTACAAHSRNQLTLKAGTKEFLNTEPMRGLMRVRAVGPDGATSSQTYTLIEMAQKVPDMFIETPYLLQPGGGPDPSGNRTGVEEGVEVNKLPPVHVTPTSPAEEEGFWAVLQRMLNRLRLEFFAIFR